MIIVPDKTGEIQVELTPHTSAHSFALRIETEDKYSVWSSAKHGTVSVFDANNLHTPIASYPQFLSVTLKPGDYIVALSGDIGRFVLNVTTIGKQKPAITKLPVKPEPEPEIHEAE